MSASKDERDRILGLVEGGQVTAIQAAQLLDALEREGDASARPNERGRDRTLRIRVTNPARAQKATVSVLLPLSIVRVSLRLGARLVPQLSSSGFEDLLRTVDESTIGRLLDVQDLEKGERLEIFVE
jgi:hypothetical protein